MPQSKRKEPAQTVTLPVNDNGTGGALAEVEYRVVQDKEMEYMEPVFARLGWTLPDPAYGKVVVAEAGGMILGFAVVQFMLHAEPQWVNPLIRGTGVAEGIAKAVQTYIEEDCKVTRYIVTAKPGSFGARLAEGIGMTILPQMAVFVKDTRDQTPRGE